MRSRGITAYHRKEIIRLLKESLNLGVLSVAFYDKKIYRYSARLYDLRKAGYIFAKHSDSEGNSNYDRFWLIHDPETKQTFQIPQGAKIVGKKQIAVEIKTKPKVLRYEKVVRQDGYEFLRPVYA